MRSDIRNNTTVARLENSPGAGRYLSLLPRYCWALFLSIFTYAFFTYPRVWWQDVVHGWSVAMVPALVFGLMMSVRTLRRRGYQFSVAFIAMMELACLVRIGWVIRPYIWHTTEMETRLPHVRTERFLLLDLADGSPDASQIAKALAEPRPTVVVVLAAQRGDALSLEWAQYPHKISSDVAYEGRVDLRSSFPVTGPTVTDFGIEAYPALMSRIRVSPEVELEIAAFDLQVPRARLDFERSRVSARRVASAVRYSTYPRMVFGGFRMPPTAPPTTMYVEYLRLKSVFFTRGLTGLWEVTRRLFDFSSNINVFTAQSIKISDVKEWTVSRDGFRGLAFTAALPASPREDIVAP